MRRDLAGLEAEDFIDSDVSEFHPNPELRRAALDQLSEILQEDLEAGGRHLRLIATPAFNEEQERLGTAMEWSDRTDEVALAEEKRAKSEADALVANENPSIRVALDNVSSSVMMADMDRKILYMNSAAQTLFQDAEEDIRQDLPNFDAGGLLGASIDDCHKKPAHQAEVLRDLEQRYASELKIGGRTMRIVANPVANDAGKRLGTAVEWTERTAEVAVEAEVEAIVAAARKGDLSQRIATENKSGFFEKLGIGINALIDQVETFFDELSDVMAAMAAGDLTRAVQREYQRTHKGGANVRGIEFHV